MAEKTEEQKAAEAQARAEAQAAKEAAAAQKAAEAEEKKSRRGRAEEFDPEKMAAEQAKIGAKINGQEADGEIAALDDQYRSNWEKQQRAAYPELYRQADARREAGGEPAARPGAPLYVGGAAALEPGHDPTLDYEKHAAQIEGTAGSDNVSPSSGRATNTIGITDPSLLPR